MNKTLYHSYSDNCCAYCNLHGCFMTTKQMRKKECLKKQCRHLKKNEAHMIWTQRARMKEIRKQRNLAKAAI